MDASNHLRLPVSDPEATLDVSFRTEDDMDRFLTDAVAMQELLQERRTQEKQHYGCNLQIGDTVTLAQPARELSGQASRQS